MRKMRKMSCFETTATLQPPMGRGPLKRQSRVLTGDKARRGVASRQGFTSGISRNPRSRRRSPRLTQPRGTQEWCCGGVAKRADPAYLHIAVGDIAPTEKSANSKRKTREEHKMAERFKVPVQIRKSSRLAATAAMKAQYPCTSDEPSPLRDEASVQRLGAKLGDRTLEGKDDLKLQGNESITKAILPVVESSATMKLQFTIDPELVLDKFIKLTQDLADRERLSRRLKLPNIAIGYFDESGGSLSVDEYEIHLTIPRGAIPKRTCQLVYVYVNPTAPPTDGVDPKEVALSPSVKCGPEGLTFEEGVVLSFCHHNALFSEKCGKLAVRMRHEGSTKTQWEAFDGSAAAVTERKVILLVDHFTRFALFGTPSPGSFKQLKVGAFGGVLETHCRQYAFRIHVWNDEENAQENVLQRESHMKSFLLDVFRDLAFYVGKGDLAVKVSDLENGWVTREPSEQNINEEKIRLSSSSSVTFNLRKQSPRSPEDAGVYCIALTHQSQLNEDERRLSEVRLAICPRQGLCDTEGAACSGPSASSRCRPADERGAAGGFGSQDIPDYMEYALYVENYGEVAPQDYGGLSAQAVYRLCVHLDKKRGDSTLCMQLVEELTNLPGGPVAVVAASGKVCAKDVLKFYFEACRINKKTQNESMEMLVQNLRSRNMERAVEIITEDVNRDVR